jgi:hypothetical protein
MPQFIPGLELSRLFYAEIIQPLLAAHVPDLRYDAALIGAGSEVLGFDDATSTDHNWGPRLTLYLAESDVASHAESIDSLLRQQLPRRFRGYATGFRQHEGDASLVPVEDDDAPFQHLVRVTTLRAFIREYLGIEWDQPLAAADWLTFPQQKLRALTSGAVYHAGLGEVTALRAQFEYFPRDVWLYLMAASWKRIEQEEPFMGRCADAGDELGSRVLAARLARDVMHLSFLQARHYAPYPKWFGTGFARLDISDRLTPLLHGAMSGADWRERESFLSQAYMILAEQHNRLGVTQPLTTSVEPFFDRPYQVIRGGRFYAALIDAIEDEAVRRIATRTAIGGIDHFSDSTDLREGAHLRAELRALYGAKA